jgi:hypothetical protein
MMQLTRRQTGILAIAVATLVALTLFLAPSAGNLRQRGSTYSRSPDGYGAWYALMEQRGTPVQRWQKPLEVFLNPSGSEAKRYALPDPPFPTGPRTLIRISNGLERLYSEPEWVKAGNTLVLLGVNPPATQAPFTSDLDSSAGKVRIQTSRREAIAGKPELQANLQDAYGSVVWTETLGKGTVIYASTAFLAANAYQEFPANAKFLAERVTQPGQPLWVDEYMHGYQDSPVKDKDGNPLQGERSLLTYLMQTPLALVAIQSLVVLFVLLWGQNRRLGPPARILTPPQDNSEAYIQALAGVLHKAEASDFVLETLGKAEQLNIQKSLGLGTLPLPLATLTEAWERHTGQPSDTLASLLKTASHSRRVSESDLLRWVDQMNEVKRQLAGRGR